MSQTVSAQPMFESVLHPTDFSEGSLVAFHHALKAALLAKSKLTLLNVAEDGDWDSADFPGVRQTLERWQLLPQGSPKSAVSELGIRARKIIAEMDNPAKAVLDYLQHHRVDLIVLATHKHD